MRTFELKVKIKCSEDFYQKEALKIKEACEKGEIQKEWREDNEGIKKVTATFKTLTK